MDNEALIGYCELHCQSERALFSSADINRMLVLAGNPTHFVKSVPEGRFFSVHEQMEELCRLARARLRVAPQLPKALVGADMTNIVLFPVKAAAQRALVKG